MKPVPQGGDLMTVRRQFRELIAAPELLVLPGVYDGLSARIAEASGFRALVAGGNAAVGSMLGGPDIGQSNMRDYAEHYARIAAAVKVPVTVDADTGFGDVLNVRQTVRALESAGVAGLMISDQDFPNRCGYLPGKSVIDAAPMVAKIKAALDARQDPNLVIIARTDAADVNGLDDAIERCHLFLEAGADLARPQGVDTPDAITRVVGEVPCPFIGIMSQAAGSPRLSFDRLNELGAAGVTLPTLAIFAAAQAVSRVMRQVRLDNGLDGVEDALMPLSEYYELVGLERELAAEQKYHDAGFELVEAFRSSRTAGTGSNLRDGSHGLRSEGSATPAPVAPDSKTATGAAST
jgi:2-methylisocitrate lyase-like PEP mutase family enzyme